MVSLLTETIISATRKSIGECTPSLQKHRVPWWNKEIGDIIRIKKKALKKFHITKDPIDFITIKKLRAQTRLLVNKHKKLSWKSFVSEMNTQTDSKKTWNKIRTLKGISRDKKCYLVENDTLVSDPQTVADKLARYFYDNSSDQNYDTEFLSTEKTKEPRVLDTPHQYQNFNRNQILIDSKITSSEFEIALSKCNSKSPGPDGIPFSFLRSEKLSF